jgi:hypothetical protein
MPRNTSGLGGCRAPKRNNKLVPALILLARPPRLERGTLCLEGRCSIQLSYGRDRSIPDYYARLVVKGKLVRNA